MWCLPVAPSGPGPRAVRRAHCGVGPSPGSCFFLPSTSRITELRSPSLSSHNHQISNTNSEAHVTDYVQAPSPRRAVASPQAGQAAAPTCAALAYASPPNPGPAAVTQPPGLLSSAPRQQAWSHAKASPSVPQDPSDEHARHGDQQ